jgi:hypothetical protein
MNERRMKKSPADACDASKKGCEKVSGERGNPGAGILMTQHGRPCQICRAPQPAVSNSNVIPGRAEREPGISRFSDAQLRI